VNYDLFGNEGLEVKKEQLARRLARESGITPAAAADELDRILNDILKRVRRGQSASLPGLGTFWPGPTPEFYFEQGLPPGARGVPSLSAQRARVTKRSR
jgi:hypothetical protein